MESCHKKVTNILLEVADKFDNVELYDNNGAKGSTKLIATGGRGNKLTAVKGQGKAFMKFVEKSNTML